MRIRFHIEDKEYTLWTEESKSHMRAVETAYQQAMADCEEDLSSYQKAILVGIRSVSEQLKLKAELAQAQEKIVHLEQQVESWQQSQTYQHILDDLSKKTQASLAKAKKDEDEVALQQQQHFLNQVNLEKVKHQHKKRGK